MSNRVQTIQATGKRFKGLQLFGAVIMACGLYAAFSMQDQPDTLPWSVGAAALGFLIYLQARSMAWWHHG
jgi:hypothetical protein